MHALIGAAVPFLLAAAVIVYFGVLLTWPRLLQSLVLKSAANSFIPTPKSVLRFYRSRGFLITARIIGGLGVCGGIYVLWHLILGR